ncbi:hypothetical protein KY358_01190, partial [Candidatus Woesearchaeota archaeon]|nr:hypothetical protein [Candidatus Woesearchaeota archaeon]
MRLSIRKVSDNPAICLAIDTVNAGKQAMVFANSKRSAEKAAEDISMALKKEDKGLRELSEKTLNCLARPTKQCERLSMCIRQGAAFHHAGLNAKQKDIIEESFRQGVIKVICSTPTLAFGLDLPAYRVILKDLRRYGPRGLQFIPVLEFLQMAGRAGRPRYDKKGEAIMIARSEDEKEKLFDRYMLGEPEEIYSKLAVEPVLRTYILSLIASDFVNTKKDIFDFFSKTFWAFQFADTSELQQKIESMLGLLDEWGFLEGSKDDFENADELGDERYRATPLGKRAAELYVDPLTANRLISCIRSSAGRKISSFSFLHMISNSLELRPSLKARKSEFEKVQEELIKNQEYLLEDEPDQYDPEYADFLDSIKTAMFFEEWIDEKDEEYLLENYSIRPGEIRAKLNIADWLLYSAEELARILKMQPLLKEIMKLRIRLKNGVKEELIPLLKFRQIGRVRARKLYKNSIKDMKDVKEADLMKLAQIIGSKAAASLKSQVGQDPGKVKVKQGKRKGQISLKDYA